MAGRAMTLAGTPLMCTLSPGTGTPLFLMPSVGTTPLSLVRLARAIAPRRPVHAFAYAGFDDDRTPFDAIEDLAQACVDELLAVAPRGPYLLGGHCLGATVALEIARQLEARGERVGCVAVLDAVAPLLADDGIVLDAATVASFNRSEPHLRQLLQDVAQRTIASHAALGDEAYRRLVAVVMLQVNASVEYRARVLRAPVRLFDTGVVDLPAVERWARIAGGGFERQAVPGDTLSMLRQPHVEAVGHMLGRALEAV